MIPNTQTLSDSDLREIAVSLRTGRLRPPFTPTALGRYCSNGGGRMVAVEMQGLVEDGMKTDHLALMLDVIAESRATRPEMRDPVELVWTGPERPGIANRDTSVVVRELFSTAEESVLIAGYAVYQGRDVFRALAERMDFMTELKVRMFLNVQRRRGDTTAESEILREFAHRFRTTDWPGQRLPDVFYDPRSLEIDAEKRASMHAKCIVVDHKLAFVSSANFTEAAQMRNIEVGVLVRSQRFAERLAEHFETLACAGSLLRLNL